MKLNKQILTALAASGLFVASGMAQDKMDKMGSGKMSKTMAMDKKFVMDAASGGMTEVALGKMAAEKGMSPDVKSFGQKMVDDHSKANDKLMAVAKQENIMVPSEMNAKDKAMVAKMTALSGKAFDKAYVSGMVADHKKDVADFTKESTMGKDEAVKGFASETLPTLKDHQKMIMDIQSKMMSKKGM